MGGGYIAQAGLQWMTGVPKFCQIYLAWQCMSGGWEGADGDHDVVAKATSIAQAHSSLWIA